MKNEPLVGPRAHERERTLAPQDVQLVDGSPLYHLLLEDPTTAVLSPTEAQMAKRRLSVLIEKDPDRVLSCQGKTREEAKAILKAIESEQEQKAA